MPAGTPEGGKKRFCIALCSSEGQVLEWDAWNQEYLRVSGKSGVEL